MNLSLLWEVQSWWGHLFLQLVRSTVFYYMRKHKDKFTTIVIFKLIMLLWLFIDPNIPQTMKAIKKIQISRNFIATITRNQVMSLTSGSNYMVSLLILNLPNHLLMIIPKGWLLKLRFQNHQLLVCNLLALLILVPLRKTRAYHLIFTHSSWICSNMRSLHIPMWAL